MQMALFDNVGLEDVCSFLFDKLKINGLSFIETKSSKDNKVTLKLYDLDTTGVDISNLDSMLKNWHCESGIFAIRVNANERYSDVLGFYKFTDIDNIMGVWANDKAVSNSRP